MLFAGLWVSYGLAEVLTRRGMPGFANAAILLGVSIFGASIMLISQMYHIDGNPPDGVLAWFAGALLAGVALRSNPSLALAMILAVVWGCMNGFARNEVYWPFLVPWALVSAAYYWHRWRPGLHLSGLALTCFIVSLGYFLADGHAHGLVVALGLGVIGASFVGRHLRPDLPGLWPGVANYGLVISFAGLFALQFIEDPKLDVFILLAVLALAISARRHLLGPAASQSRRSVARLYRLLVRDPGRLLQDHRHDPEYVALLPGRRPHRLGPCGPRAPPAQAPRNGAGVTVMTTHTAALLVCDP